MNIPCQKNEQSLLITVPFSALDARTAPDLTEGLASVSLSVETVVLDLEGVSFIDSCGLGTLLSLQRKVRAEGGRLWLMNLGEQARTMFQLVHMERVISLCASVEEAENAKDA